MFIPTVLSALAFLIPNHAVDGGIVCEPTLDSANAHGGQIVGFKPWAGVEGYYNWQTHTIGLSPQTCTNLQELASGFTWQRGYAVFTLAHEIGHSSGIFPEEQADCFGAKHSAQVAYALGLRGREAFAMLKQHGLSEWGYSPIPASCFPG